LTHSRAKKSSSSHSIPCDPSAYVILMTIGKVSAYRRQNLN
jgi:hypothetical protein